MSEAAPRRNIELKASDPSPDRSLAVCREIGAVDEGTLCQRDTYFEVRNGTLKLRQQDPGEAQLIHYRRDSLPEARESVYRIVPVSAPEVLGAALAEALGVRGVVAKRRRLHFWRGVRIHLDRVEGLGSFIEFEAVAPPDSDLAEEHRLVDELREAFGVTDDRLCSDGYAAQLLARPPA
jgi:adenylate cyclase, class 2